MKDSRRGSYMASTRNSDLNIFSLRHGMLPTMVTDRGNKSSTEIFPSPHKTREINRHVESSTKLFFERDFE